MLRGTILLVLLILTSTSAVLSQCKPAPDTRRTDWGHQNVVIIHSEPMQTLTGIVIAGYPGVSQEDVLVEVFDHPELAQAGNQTRTGQKRLKACVTQKDGTFSIDLPFGKYEVRCSKPVEWNCTSVIVTLSKKGSSKRLNVRLEVAD
jgi:hypothetical protein